MKDDVLVFSFFFSDHLRNQFKKKMKERITKKKLELSQQNEIECTSFKNNHEIRNKLKINPISHC